jgi:hypothetical protein
MHPFLSDKKPVEAAVYNVFTLWEHTPDVIRVFRAARGLPQQVLLPRGYGNCVEFEPIDPLAMDNTSGSDESDDPDEDHLDEEGVDAKLPSQVDADTIPVLQPMPPAEPAPQPHVGSSADAQVHVLATRRRSRSSSSSASSTSSSTSGSSSSSSSDTSESD